MVYEVSDLGERAMYKAGEISPQKLFKHSAMGTQRKERGVQEFMEAT